MARDVSGQKRHWQKVKALAADIDVTPRLVQFHWCKVLPLADLIHKGNGAAVLRARGICEDQEDYGEELCEIAAAVGCVPRVLRKHAKILAPMRSALLAGDSKAIDFVKALVDPPTWTVKPGDPGVKTVPGTAEGGIISVVDQLVEDKLDRIKKGDTKKHFQIMAWAVKEIGGIPEAEKALAAVKVMAS